MDEKLKILNKKIITLESESRRQKTLIQKLENDNKKIIDQNKFLNEQFKKIMLHLSNIDESLQNFKIDKINTKALIKHQDDNVKNVSKRVEKVEKILRE